MGGERRIIPGEIGEEASSVYGPVRFQGVQLIITTDNLTVIGRQIASFIPVRSKFIVAHTQFIVDSSTPEQPACQPLKVIRTQPQTCTCSTYQHALATILAKFEFLNAWPSPRGGSEALGKGSKGQIFSKFQYGEAAVRVIRLSANLEGPGRRIGKLRRNRTWRITCLSPSTLGAGNRSSSSSIPDALPYLGSESDWREFRAQLVSQARGLPSAAAAAGEEWAHAVPRPERGALLLAHPQLFQTSQTYFHRAAILVMEHGPQGSYGLILNRPSPLLLRDVQLSRPQPQFGECRVYMGGDVGQGEVQILHPHGHLSGAVEVVKGVYAGGMEAARQAVDAGSVQAGDFRWFNAYAGWAPGQLEAECRRGVWFPAAASPRLLLEPVAPGQGAAYWHRVMQMMGGHHETLSRVVQKHEQRADTP
ncbi:hypothetical protein Agub_g1325 [Astrephomene gubernaculifera]|uniref:Uncharacterized protein n=1 Tax=Astrephomene gubernaculifera TaxID=47775 RepID=A0AAD3DHE3_9CHLO|nr:hypothetical protein Agub_g1325 [Astrephomene gubernaculifera]